MASLPKASYEQTYQRFTTYELSGYYGSLPHVLHASNYMHFSFEGFRQSSDDFIGFMSGQGYKTVNYSELTKILQEKNQLDAASTKLGLFDGYFFQESAEIMLQCLTSFTAHLMTCSTHSPWEVPATFSKPFQKKELNAFAYLDSSIQAFIERMEKNLTVWEKTLVVIIADHTSITFGDSFLERFRIPLIFYSPHSIPAQKHDSPAASQVDVLPTVLALLPGDHEYAGLGKNLLDSNSTQNGLVTGTTEKGYYLKNNLVLEFTPRSGEVRVLSLTNGSISVDEAREKNPELQARLLKEYFSEIELSKRLSLAKRVFPDPEDFTMTIRTRAKFRVRPKLRCILLCPSRPRLRTRGRGSN